MHISTVVAFSGLLFSGAWGQDMAPEPSVAPDASTIDTSFPDVAPDMAPMVMGPESLLKSTEAADEPECCSDAVATLMRAFPYQADLITDLDIVDALADLKGTIVLPTEEAFANAIAALDLDLTTPEDLEIVKEVVLYHLVPNNVIYDGASADGSIRVNSLLSDDSPLAAVCGDLPFTSMFRIGVGFGRIVSEGNSASFVETDIELCGPIVVHVIDTVLLPCALLG